MKAASERRRLLSVSTKRSMGGSTPGCGLFDRRNILKSEL
jgi:hypothetical protein